MSLNIKLKQLQCTFCKKLKSVFTGLTVYTGEARLTVTGVTPRGAVDTLCPVKARVGQHTLIHICVGKQHFILIFYRCYCKTTLLIAYLKLKQHIYNTVF